MYAYQLVQHVTIKNIILNDNSPFNIKPLKEDIQSMEDSISSFDFIKNYDLSKLISPYTLNQTFPCHFFNGNLGWISEQNGHYRYFSKSYNGKVQLFDLFDFLTAYYETHSREQIINSLFSNSNVTSLDKVWRRRQEERYLYNLQWIDRVKELSPIGYITLKSHIDIYKALNDEGFRHLGPMFLSVDKDAIFFVSSRFLGKKMEISASKIVRVIVFLEELGLLVRIEDEELPESYLNKSMELKGKGKNRVNYYRMTDMRDFEKEVLEKCEEYAMKGIRYTSKK